MSGYERGVQQEQKERPHELLICAEIVPVLPNLSVEDRRSVCSYGPRHQAVATIVRAANELLAEATGGRTTVARPAILASNQRALPDVPGEEPGSPPETEPAERASRAKTRRLRVPVAIGAALLTLALLAALGLGAASNSSTHVAATKTPPSTGSQADANTPPPPTPTSAAPSAVEAPAATAADGTANTAVPDYAVPPLAGAPPSTGVVCPAGKVTVAVREVRARQSATDPTGWDVSAVGTLTNGTATPIIAPSVNVTIATSDGDDPAYGDSNSSQLDPGQTGNWNATSYVSSKTTPTATAQPGRWVWADSRYADCPTADNSPAQSR